MTQPNDIQDLISRWSTINDFAQAIGCGYEAARQMKLRNSIAPTHWPSVIDAASEIGVEGVSYRWLTSLRAKEPTTGDAA